MNNTNSNNKVQNSESTNLPNDLNKDSSDKSNPNTGKTVAPSSNQPPEKKSHEEQTQDGKKIKETDPNNPKADTNSIQDTVDQSEDNATNQSDDDLQLENEEKVNPTITFSSKLNSEVESTVSDETNTETTSDRVAKQVNLRRKF